METIKRTFRQYADVFGSFSASQRATLLVVTAMLLGAFGWFLFGRSSSSHVPASFGKTFSAEEMQSAREALQAAGLTGFKRKGSQLLVPRGQVDRYNAALLEGGGLPHDWASELEKQDAKDGIFSSDRKAKARRDIALARELSRLIKAVPDVADASVVWARSQPRRFPLRTTKVTATVNVRPNAGRQLSQQLVHSLRAAVANMIPDLKPADVTVFDLSTGISHTGEQDGPFDGKLISWIKQHTQLYQRRIESALSHIPGVIVSVNVELDTLRAKVEQSREYDPKKVVEVRAESTDRSQSVTQAPTRREPGARPNQPRSLEPSGGSSKQDRTEERKSSTSIAPSFTETRQEYLGAMPRAVQVSVSIPDDYYNAVAVKRGLAEGENAAEKQKFQQEVAKIKTEVEQSIRETVARNIPTGSPAEAVNVASHASVDTPPEMPTAGFMEQATHFLKRWGGAIALGLFALWAVWMVYRSMPQLPETPPETQQPPTTMANLGGDDDAGTPQQETPRDRLRSLTADKPDVTAAILSNWLTAAK